VSTLESTLQRIGPVDPSARVRAWDRLNNLTKPVGSLGRLEDLAAQLCAIAGRVPPPPLERKAVLVMAGDHGVTAEGVSAYPSAVTQQMVLNFLQGRAAINVLARQYGARVVVVDMGVAAELPPHPELVAKKIRAGTANFAREPAMTREEAQHCIEAGIEVVERESARGLDIVATGDMGIGNTTAASAIAAAMTGEPVSEVTGRGAGLGERSLGHKIAILEAALRRHRPNPQDPLDVLAKVGGCEIGGLAGAILGAVAQRIPVVLDGFIAGAAALIAVGLHPLVKDYCIAAHESAEPGHKAVLRSLGMTPLLRLEMRLGEGTGAVIGMSLAEAAARIIREMLTFEEAQVSRASPTGPERPPSP
jgi:nicotinate-nucleotide--dimethylbenzimidazole phosphoribosyltransferase